MYGVFYGGGFGFCVGLVGGGDFGCFSGFGFGFGVVFFGVGFLVGGVVLVVVFGCLDGLF